jgi:hypothetical protein
LIYTAATMMKLGPENDPDAASPAMILVRIMVN